MPLRVPQSPAQQVAGLVSVCTCCKRSPLASRLLHKRAPTLYAPPQPQPPLQAMANSKAATEAYDFDGEDDEFAASPVPKPKAKVGCPGGWGAWATGPWQGGS